MGEEEQRDSGAFSWIRDVYENLDFYLSTDEGRRRLEEIAREEAERLSEEVVKVHKPQREIIWMSKWCESCRYSRESKGRYLCEMHGMRLVKPFYGRPIWAIIKGEDQEGARYVLNGIDWDERWKEVEDYVVEMAMGMINGGRPYSCYEPREESG